MLEKNATRGPQSPNLPEYRKGLEILGFVLNFRASIPPYLTTKLAQYGADPCGKIGITATQVSHDTYRGTVFV